MPHPCFERFFVWFLAALLGLVSGLGEGLHLVPGCGHGIEVGNVVLWVGCCSYENSHPAYQRGEPEVTVPGKPAPPIQSEESCPICSKLGNKQFRLKPGMFASMVILLNGDGQTPSVPKAAVLEDSGQKIVFVKQDDDSFIRREVKTGPIDGDFRQIEEGLQPGELVVIRGNHELKSELHEEVLEAGHVH